MNEEAKNKEMEGKQQKLMFAAIDKQYTTNIISSKEKVQKGLEYVIWGTKNSYPQYISDLADEVTVLRTVINGIADYVCGENIMITHTPWQEQVNGKGDTVEDVVRNLALDLARYGGFALNVIRNKMGSIAEVYYIDLKNLRSDEEGEFFTYSKKWNYSYGNYKVIKLPKFRPEGSEASSIYFYKNNYSTVYPLSPIAGDAAIAAETEKEISRFHLNSIKNGFSANVIVNFNNGVPDDDLKDEIVDNLTEKFSGSENASRMMVSFNDNKDRAVTVEKVSAEDFSDRYQALAKSTKQEIYSAYRAQPVLFGLPAENLGFSNQDITEAWKVFNKCVILPYQKVIKRAFEYILGEKEIIQIEPFNIDWTEDETNEIVK